MPKNKEIIDNEEYDEDSNSSNSEIEINDKPKKERKVRSDKIIKEKKPYVLTDARKQNIEKAREIRNLKIEQKKKEQEEMHKSYFAVKKKLKQKKHMK